MKKPTLIIGLFLYSIMLGDNCAADAISAQLQQLQTQIKQLQTEIKSVNPTVAGSVQVNANAPLGEFSSAFSLLQTQDQYSAPITLGAEFSAAVQTWGGSHLSGVLGRRGEYSISGSAIALTTADLDVLANINAWTQAFITIQGGLNGYSTMLSQAFLNFGDLNKSPFYATVGDTTLPFGSFQGGGPLTETLAANAFASTDLSQIDLGYSTNNLNSELALFNGQNNFNNFVLSSQYQTTSSVFIWGIGASYMNDIRYAGNDIAAAYGTSNGTYNNRTEILQGGANGVVDFNSNMAYNFTSSRSLFGAAEWSSTTGSATVRETGDANGRMQAWTLTGGYSLPVMNKSTTFAVNYSATTNMPDVPLQLPGAINKTTLSIIGVKNQWLGYFNTEIFNNIYIGPELAWLKLYNGEHTWESALVINAYL